MFQFPYCTWEFKMLNEYVLITTDSFQFPYCAWEFNDLSGADLRYADLFQFPYCAWEFNKTISDCGANVENLFQFPYCAWEFNQLNYTAGGLQSKVSIPILRVGVQLRIDVSPSSPFDVSIPILHVGVQRILYG